MENKEQQVFMRVTSDDKRLIRLAAEREVLSVSAWLRRVALLAARNVMGKSE